MSQKFSLDDYVDVAERIDQFSAEYPDGSLQSELVYMDNPAGWLCVARAYRHPKDPRPGVGHAFEMVPGKTPYTKDSEAQNAETAAWGRAIVALGFKTKKIASKQEVKARQPEQKPSADFDKVAAELIAVATKLGAGEATADAISRHQGDIAWLNRQLATAKANLAQREAA